MSELIKELERLRDKREQDSAMYLRMVIHAVDTTPDEHGRTGALDLAAIVFEHHRYIHEGLLKEIVRRVAKQSFEAVSNEEPEKYISLVAALPLVHHDNYKSIFDPMVIWEQEFGELWSTLVDGCKEHIKTVTDGMFNNAREPQTRMTLLDYLHDKHKGSVFEEFVDDLIAAKRREMKTTVA